MFHIVPRHYARTKKSTKILPCRRTEKPNNHGSNRRTDDGTNRDTCDIAV